MHPNIQIYMPKRLLSRFAGMLANCRWSWLSKILIDYFIWRYDPNIEEAEIKDKRLYPSFNEFFTRALEKGSRPILRTTKKLISPVDGTFAQIGSIDDYKFIHAKGHDFTMQELLAKSVPELRHGVFATFYLAPHDYHRVHCPIKAMITKMTYIPGKLFSVNLKTTAKIRNLFSKNERLVIHLETKVGKMAIVLVGAMLVGSMATPWTGQIKPKRNQVKTWYYNHDPIKIKRGEEIGRFLMGSTAILVAEPAIITWFEDLHEGSLVKMGQAIANLK